MRKLTLQGVLAPRDDFALSEIHWLQPLQAAGGTTVLSASLTSSAIGRLVLEEGGPLRLGSLDWSLSTQRLSLADVSVADAGLDRWFFSLRQDGSLFRQAFSDPAGPGRLRQVTDTDGTAVMAQSIHAFSVGATSYLATGATDGNGMSVFQVTALGALDLEMRVRDFEKASLDRVMDFATVTLAGNTYLVSASHGESGVSSFLVPVGGAPRFIDSLSQKDGLWINGLVAIEAMELGGQGFVLGVSPTSGTLSVLRINPMGVFFVADVVADTQRTRFGDAVDLAVFRAADRGFAVIGGTDQGLTFFELLPDGRLFHHYSLAQDLDWDVGPVRSVSAHVLETEVQILVGSARGGLVQFSLPLAALPDRIDGTAGNDALSGGSGDDLILGNDGNDGLSGGPGDDTLIAGQGTDQLWGGGGHDVFVFEADGQPDRIMDFQVGVDRIHLGDWGRIYHVSALDIRSAPNGAVVRWHAEEVRIYTDTGEALANGGLAEGDFLFD